MPHPLARRKLRRIALPALLACFACSGDSITFTAEEDSAIMALLESSWVASGGPALQLTLCEDQLRSDAWNSPGDCQEAHVVRGGGRGLEHEEETTGRLGCGGCPFIVLAYLQGTLSGGPFAAPVAVQGSVDFGDLYDVEAIFSYPYRLSLACTGEPARCYAVDGWLQVNGQLELVIHLDSALRGDYQATLSFSGAASCTGQ